MHAHARCAGCQVQCTFAAAHSRDLAKWAAFCACYREQKRQHKGCLEVVLELHLLLLLLLLPAAQPVQRSTAITPYVRTLQTSLQQNVMHPCSLLTTEVRDVAVDAQHMGTK